MRRRAGRGSQKAGIERSAAPTFRCGGDAQPQPLAVHVEVPPPSMATCRPPRQPQIRVAGGGRAGRLEHSRLRRSGSCGRHGARLRSEGATPAPGPAPLPDPAAARPVSSCQSGLLEAIGQDQPPAPALMRQLLLCGVSSQLLEQGGAQPFSCRCSGLCDLGGSEAVCSVLRPAGAGPRPGGAPPAQRLACRSW